MNERLEVRFAGRVQGVGFRYTTARLASKYSVTGYVRNLPDGRVELVLEGAQHTLRKLIDEVREVMQSCIDSVDLMKGEPTGEFGDFGIRQ